MEKLINRLRFPLMFLLLIWGVHLIQVIFQVRISFLGVFPRDVSGLLGIVFSPLIHGDFNHLVSNSFPLLVSMVIINSFYSKVFKKSFFLIYILSGLSVWLFARANVYHIGASGVVYGLVSFIFWTGVFRKNLKSIGLALIVTFLYAGMIGGVLPIKEGISWESHLYGGFVGIIVAFLFRNSIESDEKEQAKPLESEFEDRPFLPNDTFDKTRAERQREQFGDWFSD
jgi:membrane associated rhomboid family serine protease